MKILMTGATGWVGRHLGVELVRRGHELVCLVRDPKAAGEQCPFPATWVRWKDTKAKIDQSVFQGVDAIVHLLGEPVAGARWSDEVKARIYSSRIDSTRVLAEKAKENHIATFVSASAIGYYGDRGDELLSEDASVGGGFLANVCHDWERELFSAEAESRCVAIRIGVVLGRDGGALEKMLPPFLMGAGGPIGTGRQWMSWIHLDDLVRLFCEAVENERYRGPINAVSPNLQKQAEFAKCLGKQVGRPARLKTPALALRLAFGEMAEVLLASARVSSEKVIGLGFRFEFPDLEGALANLLSAERAGEKEFNSWQFVPKPLEEVFSFFSDEKNLEKITPSFVNLKVLKKNTSQLENGTLIDCELRMHGIPFHWQTQILDWNPPNGFIDVQLKGPYQLWHHRHSFESLGTGTLIRDRVRYRLPLGQLGILVAGKKVRGDVNSVFAYRRAVIAQELGMSRKAQSA